MSTEQNKAFIRRYFEAISGKEKTPALVNEYIADSDTELKHHIAAAEAAFPRYELVAEDLVAEDDKVVVRGYLRGVHKGNFMGVPATGREVTSSLIIIYRVDGGKIVEHWIQSDGLGLMQQLTAVAQS